MDQPSNEEIISQLQETNRRLKNMQNVLIGVLITTAITAVVFFMLYSKFAKLIASMESMEDF